MTDMIKKILALVALISMVFSVYFFIDRSYASVGQVKQLESRMESNELGLKLVILRDMLDRKRTQLRDAKKAGADELARELKDELRDLERKIGLLEEKAVQ